MTGLLLAALVCQFSAQPSRGAGQIIGITAGRTSSGVVWIFPPGGFDRWSSNTNRTSFTVAATVRKSWGQFVAAESGLRLVPKGFEVTGPTIHMLYAEVPLLAVIQTGPGVALFAEGGLLLGLRAHCRRFSGRGTSFREDGCGDEGQYRDALRWWDVSWDLGWGIRVPWGKGRIVLSGHRAGSLVDIQPASPGARMLNRVVTMVAGYEWDLGN